MKKHLALSSVDSVGWSHVRITLCSMLCISLTIYRDLSKSGFCHLPYLNSNNDFLSCKRGSFTLLIIEDEILALGPISALVPRPVVCLQDVQVCYSVCSFLRAPSFSGKIRSLIGSRMRTLRVRLVPCLYPIKARI